MTSGGVSVSDGKANLGQDAKRCLDADRPRPPATDPSAVRPRRASNPERAESMQTPNVDCDLLRTARWDRRETPFLYRYQDGTLIGSSIDLSTIKLF